MDATDVAAALLSAVLHAGWNAAVKASRLVLSFEAATAHTLFSEVFGEPGGCAVIRRGCL